jgi:hypothetical protein
VYQGFGLHHGHAEDANHLDDRRVPDGHWAVIVVHAMVPADFVQNHQVLFTQTFERERQVQA